MNMEILKKIIVEWLEEKVFPALEKRDAPDLVLERASEIIAVAGPRRAGKIFYMYQLIHGLMGRGVSCRLEYGRLCYARQAEYRPGWQDRFYPGGVAAAGHHDSIGPAACDPWKMS